jgi:hypothetical protein
MIATTTKEVLIAARWILANVGWCQGAWFRNKRGTPTIPSNQVGSACILGALQLVEADPFARIGAKELLLKFVPNEACTLSGFNDTVGRTKKEVLTLFDRAIKKAT